MSQRVHSYLLWGDRSEDDITKLPDEWEARVADDNRIYFVKWVHAGSQIYIYYKCVPAVQWWKTGLGLSAGLWAHLGLNNGLR